jgi:hypothetical protein
MDLAKPLKLRFLLFVENVIDLDLSPNEMAIFSFLVYNSPPEPSFEQSFDHRPIVARTDIGF